MNTFCRYFALSLGLIALFSVAQAAYASGKSGIKLPSCEAVLSGKELLVGDSPYRQYLADILAEHPNMKVSIAWGDLRRDGIFSEASQKKVTHRALPLMAFPRGEDQFAVLVKDPVLGMNLRIFRVSPMKVEGNQRIYVVRVNTGDGAFGSDDLELVSLYTALSAVPYASLVVIEQELDPHAVDSDQERVGLAVKFIRASLVKGQSPKEALQGHEPRMVQLVENQGEPFELDHIELSGFKTADGVLQVVAVDAADEYTVEYGFALRAPQMENLFKGTPQ